MANIDQEKGLAETICEQIKILVDKEAEKENIPPSIYKVPHTLRNLSGSLFTPRVIAIGPLHKTIRRLRPMEKQKVIYMHDLFRRLEPSIEETTKECVEKVLSKIDDIKSCYAEKDDTEDNGVDLAKMMVVDACFILELILRWELIHWWEIRPHQFDKIMPNLDVKRDLVLLENQIPFFVLEDIFECTIKKLKPIAFLKMKKIPSLTELVLSFLKDMNPFGRELSIGSDGTDTKYDHILGLFQSSFHKRPSPPESSEHAWPTASLTNLVLSFLKTVNPFGGKLSIGSDGADKKYDYILGLFHSSFPKRPSPPESSEHAWPRSYSAVELARAGVNFTPNRKTDWPLDIKLKLSWSRCFFWCCGPPTIRMPVLRIKDSTESVLRNLIAYEQCFPQIPNYVTSYAFALDKLVDTKMDVVTLEESRVLVNNLGSSKDAANVINRICKEVVIRDFFYYQQWDGIERYCTDYWPQKIAWLRLTYFSSPWNLMALFAALILFGLTVVQTYYSVKK